MPRLPRRLSAPERAARLRHLWREGIMRRLTFPPVDLDPKRVASRAWVLGWEALNAYAVGDNQQTRRLYKTMRELETIGLEEPVPGSPGDTRWKLRDAGGDLLLEDAEYQLLKSAVQALRDRKDRWGNPVVTGMHTEPLLWLDELLEQAPEVTKETAKS
jgi:hypothetical protein